MITGKTSYTCEFKGHMCAIIILMFTVNTIIYKNKDTLLKNSFRLKGKKDLISHKVQP